MSNTDVLKDLTQTTYDSVEGYRKAAEKTENTAIRRAFERRAEQRSRILENLNGALKTNGEKPVTSISMAGSVHQTFLKITEAIGDSTEAAIERVEEGEDYIANKFDDALKRDDLDAETRSLIEMAFRDIRDGERFSDMLEENYA
ncbi:PA2169 family four-helix-bundle protein [Erythrobacter sp. THAF29]|uniref:ferritin-like domain-containing protein n=1 Tax=Erythrobacter sp. THAF29 TaxID=2587851 RepID=UPI001267A1E9|nr:PA2169 family four-helix-bundle protein [Erythrobacter sp. THAF29]QFT77480.1 hypothetical protein FIU90_08015 [Erythrobacter sp. THAF29]